MIKCAFSLIIFLVFSDQTYAKPKPLKGCCINHKDKPSEVLNYDCSMLNQFGSERCNTVYGGNVCKWVNTNMCNTKKCGRLTKYEIHYGKKVDVGLCSGSCKAPQTECSPLTYTQIQFGDNYVNSIKECKCDGCVSVPTYTNIEISTNICNGNCNKQKDRTCIAGKSDNFLTSDGSEPSSPSSALVSGLLAGCSAGIQSGFDIFADNRCFGHTFNNCFSNGECPLKNAYLKMCLKAANVFLTNTDSLVLGINGLALWGHGLPVLNGGTWNQHDQMCLELDLSNLPGTNDNILNDIQSVGHLDVMVQDDTAVDFLNLTLQYVQCNKCIPKLSSMSHLYSNGQVNDYTKNENCNCVSINECKKYDHIMTYYEGTQYETNINIGQCHGGCSKHLRCKAYNSKKKIKSPEGIRIINVIEKCDCAKLTWNPNGLYLDKY